MTTTKENNMPEPDDEGLSTAEPLPDDQDDDDPRELAARVRDRRTIAEHLDLNLPPRRI